MDIYLPVDSEILIKIGDEVRANNTFIANLPNKEKLEN
jgi:phosphatidylserine decarboxylase